MGAWKAKTKIQDKHVVASCITLKDEGSIPSASTNVTNLNLLACYLKERGFESLYVPRNMA